MALTDTQTKNLKYSGKPINLADGRGLYSYLAASGKKFWRLGYYFEHKAKMLSLGEYPIVTLQKAREKRMEAKQLMAEGIDPSSMKKAAKEKQVSEVKDMFLSIAQEWFEARTTDFTKKHRSTVRYHLEKYIFPTIGKEHIARMEAQDTLKVVQHIEHKGQNETARRLI